MPEQREAVTADEIQRRGQDEPAWLTDRRLAALQEFNQAPLPDRAQHLWRYSDPAWFEPFSGADHDSSVAGAPVESLEERGGCCLPLFQAASDHVHGACVQQHLGSLVDPGFGRLEAFNGAAWGSALYIYVPRGVAVEEPFHVSFRGKGAQQTRRLLVVLEEGAHLNLVEEHGGGASQSRVHSVTEIIAGQASKIEHAIFQRLPEDVDIHLTSRIKLGRDARALTSMVSFGGGKSKLDVGTLMGEKGAECETIGMLYGHAKQAFDHHTLHHHTAPHTNSNLDFKVVLAGKSRSAYTGLIGIEKSAPYSEATQENRNLLLSEKARAESIPELEIDIDEVQCSHGATVGPLDPDELFYLMSRGIPEKEAVRQIVGGFLEAILGRLPEELTESVRQDLSARLSEL